ncbi:RDD family protein [Albimonas pacifica]|uniref:Uncharacterized membrane protein YckC, RDD family n=1 Tax=Albimonas pacifica TaxID=1114924 RepID=A0A1I3CIK3_9RHOB|nr:RDD family protein [Albimonas pacifica]SFH73951.1 Uncharacterized membrane protein YckC, RDD family [Albimonas pacifica]
MSADPDILTPPEGVPLRFPVAGFGVHVGAQIADIAISGLAAAAAILLLVVTGAVAPIWLAGIGAALFLIVRVPYYVLSELAWNGQTLGKKMMKIKVVAHDGGPLTPHALVLRNLMKEAEVFLPATLVLSLDAERLAPSLIALAWTTGAVAIVLSNRRRRRLGDLMAGTCVVHLPEPVLPSDLSSTAPATATASGADAFGFMTRHLEHYGAYELQTLERVLRVEEQAPATAAEIDRRRQVRAAIVERIRARIDYAEATPPSAHLSFLRAFYTAQRAHLEQRRILGEARADKFHRETRR